MKIYLNLLNIFSVLVTVISVVNAAVTLEYNEIGVLRKDGNCDLTFVNLGTEANISKRSVSKTKSKVTGYEGYYNVTIKGLMNGNLGFNNETEFVSDLIKDYIKITQNSVPITNFDITSISSNQSTFDLRINLIETCDGIIIKQTFKDATLQVANRLYYVNEIPQTINQAFDSKKFGPSYTYPFHRIHWKMNEGLEDLKKTCGIYLYFKKFDGFYAKDSINAHWEWYLSTDVTNTINSKGCTSRDFAKVLKRNYIDYHYTRDLLGDEFMGYVLKREGHVEAHMDGVLENIKSLIEVYQNSCKEGFSKQTTCMIRTEEKLTFKDFIRELFKQCLSNTIDEIDDLDSINWTFAKDGKSTSGTLKNQKITIKNFDTSYSSIPKTVDGDIKYNTFNGQSYEIPVARFVTTFECKNGSFMNDECKCQKCPLNCFKCTELNNCLECTDSENYNLLFGKCILKPGQYIDTDGNRVVCPKECKECNENGCTECADILKNPNKKGHCVCKKSYYEDEDTGACINCDDECAECNKTGTCTVCKDPKAYLSDGVCICKYGFLNKDGSCSKCDSSCVECNEFGCTVCADRSKYPDPNGNC